MPDGADAVVMVEETENARAGDVRVLHAGLSAAARRPAGAPTSPPARRSLDQGAVLNAEPHRRDRRDRRGRGRRLRPARASRFSRPATKSSTRDSRSAPGQIYDINRFTLSASSRSTAASPVPFATAPDTIDALDEAVDRAAAHDVLVFSGGSSVGERDLILDVIARWARSSSTASRSSPASRPPSAASAAAGVRHARISDVVPVERLHAARAAAAPAGASAGVPPQTSAVRSRGASSRRPDGTSSTR